MPTISEMEISEENDYLIDVVSYCAIVITIGLFSSGIYTCRKIYINKSVGAFPHLPFVAATINCSLWLMYGLKVPDFTIESVNAVGVTLQVSYLVFYYMYAENKYVVRRDFMVALGIIVTVATCFNIIVTDLNRAIKYLGLVCNFFTICFFASPLSTMSEVIRTQTTESMSFLLSVMSFFCTLSWTCYGYLISDYYVLFPNFIGLLLSLVQLSLFLLYGNQPKTRTVSLESPA